MINNIKLKAKELGFKSKNDNNFILEFRTWLLKNYDIQILPSYNHTLNEYSIIIFYCNNNNLVILKEKYSNKKDALLKGLYEACLYLNTKNAA